MPRVPGEYFGSRPYMKLRRMYIKRLCEACGTPGSPDNPLQLDHKIPRSIAPHLVGDHRNFQTLCRLCNLIKGGSSMSLDEISAVRASTARRPTPRPKPQRPVSIFTRVHKTPKPAGHGHKLPRVG